jgi:hypothetical protein
MPKLKTKRRKTKKTLPNNDPISIREFADSLDHIRLLIQEGHAKLMELYQLLHTRGLDQPGPIVETKDDIPF